MFSAKEIKTALFAASMLLPAAAFAAHPLVTDDTGTQGTGNFQLELTAEHGHQDEDGSKVRATETAATLTYGATDTLDIVLSHPRFDNRTYADGETTTENGQGDVELGLKWRFFEKEGISFALKPGLTLPTGDDGNKGLGSGKTTYSMAFVTSIEPQPWAFHMHVGYFRNRNTLDEREDLWHASVGGWRSFGEKLRLIADLGIDTNPDKASSSDPVFLVLGLIYSPSKDLDLDLGVKKEQTGSVTNDVLLGGVTLRF